MRHYKWLAASALVLAVAAGCNDDADPIAPDTALTFTAALSGANERPNQVTTPGAGTGTFTLSADRNTLSWTITMTGTNNVTASHIHVGGREVAGPIALFTSTHVPTTSNPAVTGSVTRTTFVSPLGISFDGLLALIEGGDTYLNVHTDNGVAPTNTGPGDFPGGEIRGQLTRTP